MKRWIKAALALTALLAVPLQVRPAQAASRILTLCMPGKVGTVATAWGNGTLTVDSNSCIAFDTSKDTSGRDLQALLGQGWVNKGDVLPWGSTAPLQQASATPTCTYTSTALACIDKMGANVTALTLAGMTAGTYYTLIWMQDGTGGRTLTQTAVTGAPSKLPGSETAANSYAVWEIQATSASAATFVRDYGARPLFDQFPSPISVAAATVAPTASAAQPTIVWPGMTTANSCSCVAQGALDATWGTIFSRCMPQTNALQCVIVNTAGATVVPSTTSLNIRLIQ